MKKTVIIGWIMSALPSLLLVFSASMKFAMPPDAAMGFEHLEIPIGLAAGLGIL